MVRRKTLSFPFFPVINLRVVSVVNLRLNNDVLTFINTIAEIVHSQVHSWGGQCNKNLGNAFVIVWRIGDEETLIAANSASILTRKKTTRSTRSVENMTVATEGSPSLRSYSSRRKWTSGSSDHSDSPSQKSKNSRLNSPSPGNHHHHHNHNGSSYDDSFSQQDPDENDSQVAHSPMKSRRNVHIDLRRVPGVDQIADGALIGYLKVIADINRSPEVLKYRSDPRLTLSQPPQDSSVDHQNSTHPAKPHLSLMNPSSLKTIFGSDEDDKEVVSVEERISNFFNNTNNKSSVFPNDSPVVNAVVSQQPQAMVSSLKKKIDEEKKKEEFKVRMGFGLHAGWAIEGAVGSIYKVDATYLSPHVNMAARLETSSKQYQVPLLMSHFFHELLSEIPQKKCRKVDVVTVKGSEVPIGIYTYDCFQDQIFLENNTSSSVPLTARTLHKLMSAAGMVKGGHHNSSSRKIANRRSRANSAEGRESPVTADNNNNGSSSRGNSPVVPRVSTPTGPGPRASTPDLKKTVTFSSASGEEKTKTTTSITSNIINTAMDGKGSPISISLKNINDPVDNSTKSSIEMTQTSRALPSLPSPPVLIGNRIKTMSIDEGGDDTSLLSSSPSPVSPSSRLIYSKGVRDSETRKEGMSHNSLPRSFANDNSSPMKPFSPPISPIAAGGHPPVPFLDLEKNLSRETDHQDNGSDSSPFPLKNSSSLEFDLTPRPTEPTTNNNRNGSTARESLLKSHSEEPKEDPSSSSFAPSVLPERKKLPLPPMPSGENSAKTRLLLSQVHKELVLKKPSSSSSSSPSHAKRGSVASNHSAGSSNHSHRRASHYHGGGNNGAKLPLPPLSTQHSPTARLFLGQVHKELKKIQKEVDRRKSELSQKRHKKRSVYHSSGEEGGGLEEGLEGEQEEEEEEEEEINYGDIEDYLKKLFPDSELVIPQMIDEKDGLSFSEIFLKDTDLLQLRSHLNDRFYEIFSLGVNDYIKGNWSQARLFLEDANQLREECVRHFMKTPLFLREEGKGLVEKNKERKKKSNNKKSSEELDSLLQVVNHRRQSQRSSMRMSTTAGPSSSSLDLPPPSPSNNNNSSSSSPAVRRTSLLKAALLPPLPSKKTGETEVEREENENNYNRPLGDGPSQTLLRYMKGFNFVAPADWQGFRPLTSK
jgi:hypothetical protein